ncbi:MAG: 5-(carboxyamino)imidazole ribonucleotide mutase [Planctomycetes bacterium]|nr:5-(carboxyamino)imidazole ribonucleotide mutase [Planctomycetota bacterium]
MSTAKVGIVMGSASDLPKLEKAIEVLKGFGVGCEVRIMSAHRTPEDVGQWAGSAATRGLKVLIAAAGGAAHLAGAVAARTTLPVIGIPVATEPFNGLDSLLATVQMPPGIPVATVAAGTWGAENAALLAVQMLALADAELAAKVAADRAKRADKARQADRELQGKGG